MTSSNEPQIAETEITAVLYLDGITYLPKYDNPTVFISPGYPKHNQREYSYADLVAAGAERREECLLIRSRKKS